MPCSLKIHAATGWKSAIGQSREFNITCDAASRGPLL
jgi:hypothetical protein